MKAKLSYLPALTRKSSSPEIQMKDRSISGADTNTQTRSKEINNEEIYLVYLKAKISHRSKDHMIIYGYG
jgi:hypothetical protein